MDKNLTLIGELSELKFELNDEHTRRLVVAISTSYKVTAICNEHNNPPEIINDNMLVIDFPVLGIQVRLTDKGVGFDNLSI